jgi:hypothetical protein
MDCHGNKRLLYVTRETAKLKRTWDSSLLGTFAGCVQAARAQGEQVRGDISVTVVVRSVPGLSVRCGTRVARPVRTNALTMPEDRVDRLS